MKHAPGFIRRIATPVAVASIAAVFVGPSAASGDAVGDLVGKTLNDVQTSLGVNGGGRETKAQTPTQGGYTPPLHGTDPHSQGTVAAVDLTPTDTRPYPGETDGGDQDEVVIGSSRGEQTGGQYHGHITIAALFGQEILGVDTDEGETAAGPLDAIQTGILDAICNGSGNQICLEVLKADSSTTSSGSTNSFAVATAQIGGPGGINAGVAESNAKISEDADCQTSHGDSSVADASIGTFTADALQSSSDSKACRPGTGESSTSSTSKVVNLANNGVPIPVPGCADGTPNAAFTALAPLASTVCNANDTNGSQAGPLYTVRDALAVFAVEAGGTALAKATTAGSEARATAPAGPAGNGPGGPGNNGNNGSGAEGDRDGDGIPDNADACPSVPGPESNDGCPLGSAAGLSAGEEAQNAGNGSLAFTGFDLLAVTLAGLLALGCGLLLRVTTRERVTDN